MAAGHGGGDSLRHKSEGVLKALPIHVVADRIEPRLARAVARGLQRARDRVSINDLALALARKDVGAALALIPDGSIADALSPAGTIVVETFVRGGKLGAEQVRSAIRR